MEVVRHAFSQGTSEDDDGTSVRARAPTSANFPTKGELKRICGRTCDRRARLNGFLFRLFQLANEVGCNAIEVRDLEFVVSIRLPPRAPFFLIEIAGVLGAPSSMYPACTPP
jgi:hypothetical protein